jgi:hypothetical protein
MPGAAAAKTPRWAGMAVRVTATFDVGGDLKLPSHAKTTTLPMSVVAKFDCFERQIDDGSVESERRSIRYYSEAEAAIKVDKKASVSKLAADHRLIRAALSKNKSSLSAVNGCLTREERDLIDIPCSTLALGKLLAAQSAKTGDTRKPPESDLATLLGLDAVSRSDVEVTLSALNDEVGEVSITGALDGAVGGVATEIELKGKLHYDVVHRQPFALVLLIKEKRTAGNVAPGLDVVAKLDLRIAPVGEVPQLSDAALAGIDLVTVETDPPLAFRSSAGGFSFTYEPRWRTTQEDRDAVIMRLVDRGDLVAQCNVSLLPKLDANQPFTLDAFQKEVQQSLGKHFGQFLKVAERKTAADLRMLHVTAAGSASELPITWQYYLLIDETGRRAAISFTMEDTMAERFGAADTLIVDQFRFGGSDDTAVQSGGGDNPFGKSATRPRIRIMR